MSFSVLKNPKWLRVIMNIWPPYLGSGIRVHNIASDWRSAEAGLRLRWYNRNYVNTHFGGSLFSMTDPFYMLLLINALGGSYRVWDKAARIEFIKPARGAVTARFSIDDTLLSRIKEQTAGGGKHFEEMIVNIEDEKGQTVARVTKTLYFRNTAAGVEEGRAGNPMDRQAVGRGSPG